MHNTSKPHGLQVGYIPGYVEHRIPINAVGDFIFLASFLVLGGEFWEKIRALFIYEAKARIIQS